MTGTQTAREVRMKSKAGPMKRKVYAEGATGGPGTGPAESPFRYLPVMVSSLGLRLTRRVCSGTTLIPTPRTPHPHLPLELSPDPELEKLPMSCGFDILPLIIQIPARGSHAYEFLCHFNGFPKIRLLTW